MHVRVRIFGQPDNVVVVDSKLTKIEKFRRIIKDKFDVDVRLQRLLYGGKLLEDGYTFHDYNIKLNDVIQLMISCKPTENEKKIETERPEGKLKKSSNVTDKSKVAYKDTLSRLYAVGDIIDMRDREQGAWFEGKIVRIVQDPNIQHDTADSVEILDPLGTCLDKESDTENKPPTETSSDESPSKVKKQGIAKYFSKKLTSKKKQEPAKTDGKPKDENILFKIQLEADEEDSTSYCKLHEIRPRARNVIDIKDLKEGDKVMINHNTEDPLEKGYWYDFTVKEIKKLRTTYELVGTLYLGPDAVPQNDTKVKVHDKIFAIEEVVPLEKRIEDPNQKWNAEPEKRSQPLNCLTCRDDEEAPCKDCGCFLCLGKENPEKIVLCDECNNGYHMECLAPSLKELPEEDWYCPSCKRDPNDVVAPGAAKQTKKASASKSKRDWGRGMACVGKTKTCAMPANHFGPIPGIEVGMCWRFRIQLSESGVHRPPVSGIHGRDVEGAYSIVLSGGYEDDVDNGNEFTYTGSGGRDLSGNKRTAEQSCDQMLTRENKALARNCAVKQITEAGGDAGDNWRSGKPVRVVRSYKMMKHFPKYAPSEGIRYDGIYKVVKYYPEQGISGYRVWKYLLRRDDSNPAPWEPGAKQYSITYPDGYLEAEAEKKALKEKNGKNNKVTKKRALRESNQTTESEGEASPPGKKLKISPKATPAKRGRPSKNKSINDSSKAAISKKTSNNSPKAKILNNSVNESPKAKIPSMFTVKSPKAKGRSKAVTQEEERKKGSGLSTEEKETVMADTLNSKLWGECLEVCETKGKKDFVEHVTQVFLCIICQEVAASPVTTPCLHNFCMACLKQAFKSTSAQSCPCCRHNLSKYQPEPNEKLKSALRAILAGYDAGKK